jgi:hypothetical protein
MKPISDDEGSQYEFPVVRFESVKNEVVIPEFIRLGAIQKKNLIAGKRYKGYCRNADAAVWNGMEFVYVRHKFGCTFDEKIKHFEDDDGYDVFVPYRVID